MPGLCRSCGAHLSGVNTYASDRRTCKECVRERVRQNRAANAEYYRAYDRKRYRENPERKERARAAASRFGPDYFKERARANRKSEPEKFRARNAVNNAVRDGKIEKSPCFFCGSRENLHAHHEDYSHPLDVVWLCASCHGKLHTIKGDFRRAV